MMTKKPGPNRERWKPLNRFCSPPGTGTDCARPGGSAHASSRDRSALRYRRDELPGDWPGACNSCGYRDVAAVARAQSHARPAHCCRGRENAMTCDLWEDKLDAYVDGETSAQDLPALEGHLRTCRDCAAEALGRMQMKRATRTAAAMRFAPPAELRQRIQKGLPSKR